MPIFTAIATAIAGLFSLGAFATQLIAAGLALAAKLALSYLTRPKKRSYAAVQGEVQLGGDYPASAVYGKAKLKGHRIYAAHWGSGNKYRAEVIVLSNGWCDGLEPSIFFYGQKYALTAQSVTGNEHARYFVDGFGSKIEIRFYDGRPGQLADSQLVTATATTGNPWASTAKATGLCYVVVTAEYDGTLFDKGIPEYEFLLRGLREYDPRYDSTVPGGSGAQRLASPSTWVWTQNPAIHRLNYLLGLKGVLSGRTLIGVGMDVNQIDVASHMVAATVCDATRTVSGRTIPTYAASLIVHGDDDHIEIMAEFEDAMAGYSANMNGLSGVIAGAPQAIAATLTADDIRIDDVLDVSYRRSGMDSVNILSGQFISPEANWTPASLDTVTVNADVVADGRKRPRANDFLQVTDADIGQYLLNIRYRQNRKAGKASIPVSRRFGAKTSLGDWISWNSKTWLVSGRSFDERMRFRLDLAETGSDIYSEAGITPGPIVLPPSAPVNPSLISTVAGFAAVAGLYTGDGGREVPTLQFTWTAPLDPTITQVRIFYRVAGTADEFETVCTAPNGNGTTGVHRTSSNVLPETDYEARATITTIPDRVKTFTAWTYTGSTGAGSLAVSLGDTNNDVLDLLGQMNAMADDIALRIEQVAHDAAAGTGQNIIDRRVLRKQVNNAVAQIIQEAQLRADGDSALAATITALEASVNGSISSAINQLETQVDIIDGQVVAQGSAITILDTRLDAAEGQGATQASAINALDTRVDNVEGVNTAQASAITAVQAQGNAATASGLLSFAVQSSPNAGSLVTINLMARAALTGTSDQTTYKTTGLNLEIYNDAGTIKSKVSIIADKFVVSDGTNTGSPLVFEGGQLKLQVAKIGTAIVDQLKSANDKLKITGTTGNASIELFS